MSKWSIDTDRTTMRVFFQPGIPGLGVNVSGLTGTFEATVDERGQPDLDQPIHGEFALTVDDLQLGNRILTAAVRPWLGGDEDVAISGSVGGLEQHEDDDERFDLLMEIVLRGNTYKIEGSGRADMTTDGDLRVKGRSKANLRDVGIPVPRMLRLHSLADWTLHLVPDDWAVPDD